MSGPNLNAKHRVAALLEARGELNKNEVAEAVGLSVPYLSSIRHNVPEYKLLVEKYSKELSERTLDEAAKLLAEFNKEAPHAFTTLVELHGKADRDSVRLGAAKEILDRASIAPKRQEIRDSGGAGGITIQLGSQRMGMIVAALEDIEDHETIDLLELPSGEPPSPSTPRGDITAKEAP